MNAQRLLILDDNLLTGQAIVGIAQFMSIDVRLTTEFDSFIDELQNWQPTHLMIDLIMPDKDGVEVLVELAQRGNDCQLILTSGAGEQLLQAASRSASAHGLKVLGLLPKPFNPKRFRELMQHTANVPDITVLGDSFQQLAPVVDITPDDIALALNNHDINVVYQPKVTCLSGALSGFEALARWHHPEKGFIPPDVFIPIAEREGLIDQLTVQVFKQALPFLAHWQNIVTSVWKLKLSVNISAVSIANEGLFANIEQLCQQHNIAPEQLILELTETAAMDDPVKSLDMLTRLRMRGFKLSIDDFGTGFSSMLALVRMPFSEVKIDKSFVMTAANSRESRQVIKATLDLAHSLDMTATAEGIETQESLQQLQEMGCDLAQGFFIGRPMPEDFIKDWLDERQYMLEEQRLRSLESLQLVDNLHGPRYERVTLLAKKIFDVDASFISLIDEDFQWLKAIQGELPLKTKRSLAFCNLTITQEKVLVVEDAHKDFRFAENPLVLRAPYVRFYAGCPIHSPSGEKMGALCITHSEPRAFSKKEKVTVNMMAEMIDREIASNLLLEQDHLTGLLNRRGFEYRAEALLNLCSQHDHVISICYFDLDNFKRISAQQGQMAGDESLIQFSKMLYEAFPETDLIARFGGDEFMIMCLSGQIADGKEALRKLATNVSEFNSGQNPGLRIAYSFGLASTKEPTTYDLQSLYTMSDNDLRTRRDLKG